MKPQFLALVIAAGLALCASSAAAQSSPSVRVTAEEGAVYERRSVKGDLITTWPAGTMLEVLDDVDGWYWVLLPPDPNGTRVAGWMQDGDAELVGTPAFGRAARTLTGETAEVETSVKSPARVRREKADTEAARRLARTERELEAARREYDELTKQRAEEAREEREDQTEPESAERSPF
jgi:hypothetical protein